MEFEWDDKKAATNFQKHGITFLKASRVFHDLNRLELEETRFQEIRYKGIGMVDGRVLFIVYTHREHRIRLISARKANEKECTLYHKSTATS